MAAATTSTSLNSLSFPTNHALPPHRSAPSYVTFRRTLPSVSAAYATVNQTTYHLGVATPPKSLSFYELLGVQNGATRTEIKAAYRKLALALHPDAALTSSDGRDRADEFIQVHEAYSTLSDPIKKADYDTMLLFRRRRSECSSIYYGNYMSGASKCGSRTWETDQCW